jgi:hypothetical protein
MFVLMGMAMLAAYQFYRWLVTGPRTPDPWGQEVQNATESPDAVPLCTRCLAPQQHTGWFCPNCGAVVAEGGNCLPFVYLFSIGEGMREAANRRGLLTTTGAMLIGLVTLSPIYCLAFLFRTWKGPSLRATSGSEKPEDDQPGSGSA